MTPTNTENYLPSDDPNITNLMFSHYDCEKQHNLRYLNFINMKQQCTEAPSNIQYKSVKARAKTKRIKAYKCVAYAKKDRTVLIELYETITLCHFLLHLIL